MDALTILYAICTVLGCCFLAWMKTKSGKKWLDNL